MNLQLSFFNEDIEGKHYLSKTFTARENPFFFSRL